MKKINKNHWYILTIIYRVTWNILMCKIPYDHEVEYGMLTVFVLREV